MDLLATMARITVSGRGAARFLLVLALAAPAHAATYYVRAAGSDAHDGQSPQTALASIRLAAGMLRGPGDRLVVGPGTYREGNIEPRASGTPDAPIVLLADTTGALTGEPPGAVTIIPPNTEDATTGFLVFGRRDVVIDGFTIEGARDAGIQVRPHFSLATDSTRIAVRNNTVRPHGRGRGIHLIAAGDVAVLDNTVAGAGTGVLVAGGLSGEVRPRVTGNQIEDSGVGIALERAFGGTIADNALHENRRMLTAVECRELTVAANRFTATAGRGIAIAASRDLTIADNVLAVGVRITAAGAVVLSGNRFDNAARGVGLRLEEDCQVIVSDNDLPRVYITGAAQVDVRRNRARLLEAAGAAITATENAIEDALELRTAGELLAGENQAATLEAVAARAHVTGNTIGGMARISSPAATIAANHAGALVWRAREAPLPPPAPGDDDAPIVVAGNTVTGAISVGGGQAALTRGIVEDNAAGGELAIVAHAHVQVARNRAAGIRCTLLAAGSELALAGNESRDGPGDGLRVTGAGRAVIEDNIVAGHAHGGLVVRGVGALTVAHNIVTHNGAGGLSVQVPVPGDCDEDRAVTIAELITLIGIALGQQPPETCAAADADQDGAVTVDEIVLAVSAALGQLGAVDAGALVLRANRVEDNRGFGIDVRAGGPVEAADNRALRNDGLALSIRTGALRHPVSVTGNALGASAAQGLLVEGTSAAQVRGNVIFSNGLAGILLRHAPGAVVMNNLVYDNGNDGIAVGLGTPRPAPGARLVNNSLYANAGWGVTVGSPGAPSTGVTILNNIVDGNARGGIAAQIDSLPGLTIGYNLNTGGYSNEVAPSVTDFVAAPRFVTPAGADDILGRDGFGDDDFRLLPTSAAIDAGSTTAVQLGITGSAVAGLDHDAGIVDLGYHYPVPQP